MKKPQLLLLLILLTSPAGAAPASEAPFPLSPVAKEFTEAFHRALKTIREDIPRLAGAVETAEAALARAEILVSEEPLFVPTGSGEQESVAVNEPAAQRIWIHRARWAKAKEARIREAIALHEILSLSGAESTGHYPISSAYLAEFRLRNDEDVFLLGINPAEPQWNSLYIACDQRTNYLDRRKKKNITRTAFMPTAVARWELAGKVYMLQYSLAHEEEDDLFSTSLYTQSTTTRISSDEKGEATESKSSRISRLKGKLFYEHGELRQTYLERALGGTQRSFDWKRGKKGQLREESEVSFLADGSYRTKGTAIMNLDLSLYFLKSFDSECLGKRLPKEEWRALTADALAEENIDNLNTLSVAVNLADLTSRRCGSGPCSAEKAGLKAAVLAFEKAWGDVFAARAKTLGAKKEPKIPVQRPAPSFTPKPECPLATKPTFIYPDGKDGVPVLRDVGQPLCLSSIERSIGKRLDELRKQR